MRLACDDLRSRGLYIASKWIAEQLYGIISEEHETVDCEEAGDEKSMDGESNDSEADNEADEGIPTAVNETVNSRERDLIMLGQSLILHGEFLRCAQMLRKQEPGSILYPNASKMKVKSTQGIFLATYSLYMAGEKLKQQQLVEKEGQANREAQAATQNNALPGATRKKSEPVKPQSKNPFLIDIFRDLWPIYQRNENNNASGDKLANSDAFLLYMLSIVVRDLQGQQGGVQACLQFVHAHNKMAKNQEQNKTTMPTAYDLLIRSVRIYPWNRSAWQDLENLCLASQIAPPTWEAVCPVGDQDADVREACHWVMYHHFLASFYLEQQNGDAAFQSVRTLDQWFPRCNVITTYKALAHYALRDYDSAQEAFEVARAVDPHCLAHVDTYSNILYVKEKRAELSHLAHVVSKIDKFSAEACCVVGNYYSLKGKHERAITYFQRALRANPRFLPAWTLMGHECVELRNTAAAVQCYRNAVDLSPSDYRAWYGLGQTYEMLHLHQYALYYYKKSASFKPKDARMWSAVGSQYARLGAKQDAMLAFERAMNCGDSEGVATRELARLYRDEGRMEAAAKCYIEYLRGSGEHRLISAALDVLDAQEVSAETPLSLESSVTGKFAESSRKRSPANHSFINMESTRATDNDPLAISMAAAYTVGGTANGMTPLDPERVEGALFLANYYRSCGKLACAEAFCALLVDFVGPEGDEARALIRDIRSIAVTQMQNRGHKQRSSDLPIPPSTSARTHPLNVPSMPTPSTFAHRSLGQQLHSSPHPRYAQSPGTPFDDSGMAGHLSMSSEDD